MSIRVDVRVQGRLILVIGDERYLLSLSGGVFERLGFHSLLDILLGSASRTSFAKQTSRPVVSIVRPARPGEGVLGQR